MAILKKLLVITIFSILLVSCKSTPILNISEPIDHRHGTSLNDVTDVIVRAGNGLGWRMDVIEPGLIVGTLNIRKHIAQVDINYNTESYSINYKDSTNLKYNEVQETIHSNYNGWVTNLSNAIDFQLH